MFLRPTKRIKDGKVHQYWSIVENRRIAYNRVIQQTVLYLGEINDSQKESWTRAIDVFDEDRGCIEQLQLFAPGRSLPPNALNALVVRLHEFELHRPRQWGACWLFTELWRLLELGDFWRERLGCSREGTDWEQVLQVLCCQRLIQPGSEWKLHRIWFDRSAMGDLLGANFSVAAIDTLYRCLDRILPHKESFFSHLRNRWQALFDADFEVLLYDLTSTYFESDPPFAEDDKRRFGYSRDKRSDCVQVVIALVITPDGLPLAYEVLPGNTSDKTTLRGFLKKIRSQYGKARRIWLMDRGIPTEEVLEEMRASKPPVQYLVGTPKARLGKLEKQLVEVDWQSAREGVDVKLLEQTGETYLLARSRDRVAKERAMRKRELKKLWARLGELSKMSCARDAMLIKLGEAKSRYRKAWRMISLEVSGDGKLTYQLEKEKLREAMRREGRYLLRTNLRDDDPSKLWGLYMLLVEVEEAFKNLKGDLAIRPIHHQLEHRIEAHIFVAFIAFCLHTTLRQKLKICASGLTPRSALEQLAGIMMLDAHFPTSDGRTLVFQRYTTPTKTQKIIVKQLGLEFPAQSPPKIHDQYTLCPPKQSAAR